ncbi:Hypothetical protein CINCED_3A005970 [Cinara cedri]|uniref:Uncharacterized protein n=1 Tax=Cinara cedri TaxID=506608 RepID=A0A5E4N534_9HEMI|nr:Hypothetical protein CINCED_3A005970 [Cinara cedri]
MSLIGYTRWYIPGTPILGPQRPTIFTNKEVPPGSKVNRVLQFEQSPWLAKYISLNTEMRKKAANNFEKYFCQLMNNAFLVR